MNTKPALNRWLLELLTLFVMFLISPAAQAQQTNDHLQLTVVLSKGPVFRTGRVMEIDLVLTNKTSVVRRVHYHNSYYSVHFEIRDAKEVLVERNFDKMMRISNWYGTKDIPAHESVTFPFGLNAQHDLQSGRYSLRAIMTEIMDEGGKPIVKPITSPEVRFEVK
jgi:hypothetical protein